MDYRRDQPGAWGPGGRWSFDPLTTLVAVRGASISSTGVAECSGCTGINNVSGGNNNWVSKPSSNQTYLVLRDAQTAANALDELLCQPRRLEATT